MQNVPLGTFVLVFTIALRTTCLSITFATLFQGTFVTAVTLLYVKIG